MARLFRREPQAAVALFEVVHPALGDPPQDGSHDGIVGGVGDGQLEGASQEDPPLGPAAIADGGFAEGLLGQPDQRPARPSGKLARPPTPGSSSTPAN